MCPKYSFQIQSEATFGSRVGKDGQVNGCLGYGAGIAVTSGDMVLNYSAHGHKLTTTCTIPLAEDFVYEEDLSGSRYLCLLANEGDNRDKFKFTFNSSYSLTEDGAVMTCKFYSFKKFKHANN